jgi:acetate kinase
MLCHYERLTVAEGKAVSQEPTALVNVSQTSHPQGFVLALNAGSSSLKFALFAGGEVPVRMLSGGIDRVGSPDATFTLKQSKDGQTERVVISAPNHAVCLDYLIKRLGETTEDIGLGAIGHRVVHGGPHFAKPQLVTQDMLDDLRRFSPFAPEHLPAEIDLIVAMRERFPALPQVACFDTAFHKDLPRVAQLLPIPRRYEALGVRRYGFHGLSYEFLMEELARLGGLAAARSRVILAHLGNGASIAAVRDGQCIDTSMAFTPAAGLVMGSRTGDIDPGLVAYLSRTEGVTAEQFDNLVNDQSGMLGVSEISSDMRELLAMEDKDSRAADAIALFCYQAKKWIGSFTAALGGLDTLIFSGGIGEHCPSIRSRICDGLGYLGVDLNESRNAQHADLISAAGGKVAVRVIQTDEELLIARSVLRVLSLRASEQGS